jgi:hypothetical protein
MLFPLAVHLSQPPVERATTTEHKLFAECPRHSAKAILHSAYSSSNHFVECCRVSKNTRQRKTLGILRITKNPKNNKTFFLNYGNNSATTTTSLLIALSFSPFFIKFSCFMNGEIQTRNLSLTHNLLYHYTKFYFDSFYIRGRLQNLNFKFENFTWIFLW